MPIPTKNSIEQGLDISKTFLPRRAPSSVMKTYKAGIVLSRGELFMEYPNSGEGSKGNYYFKVGDGVTPYKDLPYAFGMMGDNFLAFTDITLKEDGDVTLNSFNEYMDNIKPGASMGDIVSYLKAAINVFNKEYVEHNSDDSAHLSEKDRKSFDAMAHPTRLTNESLNDLKTIGARYYADAGNICTHKPDKNGVDGFGMEVFVTATGHLCQELTEDNRHPGRKWLRIFNGSSWTEWSQLYTSNDPPKSVDAAVKSQSDILGQKIDSTYVKSVTQKTTEKSVNLAHNDKDRQTTHEFTVSKGNDSETKINFEDENTQYQMHVKNSTNGDGNVKLELTSTDNTSNQVTIKGDKKGAKVTSDGDVITVGADYGISVEPHFMPDNTQNGVDIVLTDTNGNRKAITLRSTDETKVTAASGEEINFFIPNVAIERLVKVADSTAMYALTRDDVQNGDSVLDVSSKVMYIVIDDQNLNNPNGYQEYSAHRATELTNPRKIDGVEFNGTADASHFAICSTPGDNQYKEVACNNFAVAVGARIIVKFANTDNVGHCTLNVNGTGAKNITINGEVIKANKLLANHVYEIIYNGTHYEIISTIDEYNYSSRINELEKKAIVPVIEDGKVTGIKIGGADTVIPFKKGSAEIDASNITLVAAWNNYNGYNWTNTGDDCIIAITSGGTRKAVACTGGATILYQNGYQEYCNDDSAVNHYTMISIVYCPNGGNVKTGGNLGGIPWGNPFSGSIIKLGGGGN